MLHHVCLCSCNQQSKISKKKDIPLDAQEMAELIDNHVSVKQCRRAITALMEYVLKEQQKREENELLPGKEENIWLQLAVKEVHTEAKLKPHKMCVEPRFSPCL